MNSQIYREVFPLIPHDGLLTLGHLKANSPQRQGQESAVLDRIKGHLIHFPLDFLKEEDLGINRYQNVDMFFADEDIFT
jgi:hypothetical protein